jgi:ribonuclease H-related protein
MKKKFYAYSIGNMTGVTESWPECQKVVSGKQSARYKSFETEAEAKKWLEAGADYSLKHMAEEKGIYFDSGTGAGKGVEISVTDENGKSLLNRILLKGKINERGNHWIEDEATNNFGELLACKYALEIAIKDKAEKVFGDSRLILDYWSKGYIKKDMEEKTIELANEVKKLRYKFESRGGKLEHISGGSNPADLGFHKN